jgi:hypothetical protein
MPTGYFRGSFFVSFALQTRYVMSLSLNYATDARRLISTGTLGCHHHPVTGAHLYEETLGSTFNMFGLISSLDADICLYS